MVQAERKNGSFYVLSEFMSTFDMYGAMFVAVCFANVLLFFLKNKTDAISAKQTQDEYEKKFQKPGNNQAEFKKFQKSYLLVYLLAMLSDWVKGPYIYALYVGYGFDNQDIAILFICGFVSSAILGTIVGSFSEYWGRKKTCMLFGLVYSFAACTKLFNNFYILLLGRFASGVGTSLLFSSFESWMICEHNRRGFNANLLEKTFQLATFGNGLTAIFAGFVAQFCDDYWGHTGPFLFALVPLSTIVVIMHFTWEENYGDTLINNNSNDNKNEYDSNTVNIIDINNHNTDSISFKIQALYDKIHWMVSALVETCNKVWLQKELLYLGLSQSLYEGSMYAFVFMWNPVLEEAASMSNRAYHSNMLSDEGVNANLNENANKNSNAIESEIPMKQLNLGVIFAIFMCAVMLGSTLFSLTTNILRISVIRKPVFIHIIAAISCFVVAQCMMNTPTIHTEGLVFTMFVLFELCCGVFFPTYGSLKSTYVMEENRGCIMNLFRIPTNLFVVAVLIKVKYMEYSTVFYILGLTNVVGLAFYALFIKETTKISKMDSKAYLA